ECVEAEHLAQAGEIILTDAIYQQVQHLVEVDKHGSHFWLQNVLKEPSPYLSFIQPELNLALASRFFPRQILQKMQGHEFRGEFRQVAYLFATLPTIRDENQLYIFMQTVFHLQDQYGGLLKLFFGDKGAHLLLVWGAPAAFENDVERALNFILDLQSRTTMPINGGVTYRVAHAGYIGSDLAEDFSAFGRGANLAARFMTGAPRGEIWVDENIYRKTRKLFNLDFIGEQNFKGFNLAQKVFILLDRKEESEIFFDGAHTGREKELITLHEFTQPIFQEKSPGMLVIWGDPGMGKSRLVHEFIRQLEKDPVKKFQVFLCQTDEILRESLNPFRYWLRHYFQVSSSHSETRNKRSFNRKLDELIAATRDEHLAIEIDRTRSFLGALLDLHWTDSLYEQVDAKMRYENTLMALGSLLQAESCRQPVLLFLEDAHWFDQDTKTIFPRLLRLLSQKEGNLYPIAILATARLEGSGLPLEGMPYQEMHLRSLDRAGLAALAVSLLNDPLTQKTGTLSDTLLDLLQERSEGNPFFAGQILLYLRDEGLILNQLGDWEVLSPLPFSLPVEVGALLVARLDRLAQAVKDSAQTASVIGREFELKLLASMLGYPSLEQIMPNIKLAERESIWIAGQGTRYVFKHALMRDAAYQMLSHTRRQELHAQAVAAYEKIFGSSLPEYYSELAYHADKAGLADKACHYLTLTGKASKEAYQNHLAAAYFKRALELTPDDALTRRFDLLLERENVFALCGLVEERRQDLAELDKICTSLNDKQRQILVLIREANFALDTGAYADGSALALRAADLSLATNQNSLAAQAFHFLALASLRQSKMSQAQIEARQGLEIARQINDRQMESSLLNSLGMIALGQERLDLASVYFEQGLATARETGSLRDQALPLNNLGMLAGMQGNFNASQRFYEQALALAQKIGDQPGEGLVLGNLGFIAGSVGDFRKAREFTEQYLQISRQIGDPMSESYALINLSAYAGAMGDLAAAEESARNGLALTQQTGDRSAEAWSLTYLGHCLLASESLDEAAQAYQAALDIRTALEQAVLAAEPSAGLARAALQRGQAAAAQKFIQSVLQQIEANPALAGTDDPLRVYLTCYLVLRQAGDLRAWNLLKTAHSSLQARAASLADPSIRHGFLEKIVHHREILQAWEEYQVILPSLPADPQDPAAPKPAPPPDPM
ncbi:MAG: tetratricopeptide repeat protein, partial [Anaerolineaceae bacterium]|nr:tetratricopeptide repeat protein [Anaerolineaceae bacterium]